MWLSGVFESNRPVAVAANLNLMVDFVNFAIQVPILFSVKKQDGGGKWCSQDRVAGVADEGQPSHR